MSRLECLEYLCKYDNYHFVCEYFPAGSATVDNSIENCQNYPLFLSPLAVTFHFLIDRQQTDICIHYFPYLIHF